MSRESSVAVADSRDASLAAPSVQPVHREDIPMEDVLPYPDGQETPTPAGRISRTAKNKEKALGKRKRREEKRRKSEIVTQPNVQDGPLHSSEQEVEDMLQLSTELREATAMPTVKSLVETFRPEVVIGFTVRLNRRWVCSLFLRPCTDELHPSGRAIESAEGILHRYRQQCSRRETGDSGRLPYDLVSISSLRPL